MSEVRRWRESGHLERAVETPAAGMRSTPPRERCSTRRAVGGRRTCGSGAVSTQDVLNRYIEALGGTLKLIADFGDEQLKVA
ncbi:transcriptional regulator [Micromonospora sp. NPDC005367]|uniref:transcriptional regulator n=1 Tax=Micromonospora sp. NPDC005367 TaxID=3155590 RepID=UPI0033B42BA3